MAIPLLGVIADDFTGATDIASMLARGGMRVVQTIGAPAADLLARTEADAVVVALKTRSVPAAQAVAQSLASWEILAELGVEACYLKYCSTFDSTPEGNIGPVSEALAEVIGSQIVPHLPALPVNGRTVYQGHLFVNDRLLSESGMENHPLNPMTDANLVRWLDKQAHRPVGLVARPQVAGGHDTIAASLQKLAAEGCGHAIGDTVSDDDLTDWAEALAGFALVAGGSGLAAPLARAYAARGRFRPAAEAPSLSRSGAAALPALILAGSCSKATLAQIANFIAGGGAARKLSSPEIAANPQAVNDAIAWARRQIGCGPALIYTSGAPQEVRNAQEALGADRTAQLVEAALSRIAAELSSEAGAMRLIVAGGETSGAVVSALGAAALNIGPEIDPGVPWMSALTADGRRLAWLALKSGNFGSEDFFAKAIAMTEAQ